MVPKRELLKSIPMHNQGLKYEASVCELEDHVGEKGMHSNWPTKLGPTKKNSSCKFYQSFTIKHLN